MKKYCKNNIIDLFTNELESETIFTLLNWGIATYYKAQRFLAFTGYGVDLGAAAHNPFGLEGAINVSPGDGLDIFRESEIKMCGQYAEIDVCAEANNLPIEDNSLDFVVSSHVVEHLPDPIAALIERDRVLKYGAYIVMIITLRDALLGDRSRPITQLPELIRAYNEHYTVDNNPLGQVRRAGHYYVYTLQRMLEVIEWIQDNFDLNMEIILTEEQDSKVGNGFTIIARKCRLV